jgi:hypothetical protein
MKKLFLLVCILSVTLSVSATEITKVYYFTNPTVVQAGAYQTIRFDNTMLRGKQGEPVLPFASFALLVPPGEYVRGMQIITEEETPIPGTFNIYPQQPVRPISIGPDGKFLKNEAVYALDASYPSFRFSGPNMQYLNGYGFALGTFTPLKYNPAKGTVSYYAKVTLKIVSQPYEFCKEELKFLPSSPAALKRVRDLAQNPEMMDLYPAKPALKTGYQALIITPSQYVTGFDELVSYYGGKGITAQVVSVESISSSMTGQDLQEKMRNYIIQEYQNNGIEHVLLGGDVELIPYRGFYCYVISGSGYEDNNIPADLYYSALDGNWNNNGNSLWGEPGEDDLLPDVSVARMPFSTSAELEHMVHKSVSYQSNPVTGELKHPFFLAEFLYSDPMTWGQDYIDLLEDDHTDNGYFTHGIPSANNDITRLYDTLISLPSNIYNWDAPTLIAQLNDGKSFIHHCGHANVDYMMRLSNWDITDANFSQVDGVTHNYELMYSHGCLCGAFDNDDCIAEKCVTITNFLVGGVFNSRYGWFDQGLTEGPSAHLHREFVSALYNDTASLNVSTLGEAQMVSKIKTAPWVDVTGEFEPGAQRWCHYCCNAFGDPVMKIWTDEPTVGITPVTTGGKLSVSPNPTTGETWLSFTLASAGTVKVSLFNNLGQLVRMENLKDLNPGSNSYQMDLRDLREGVYSVRLESTGMIMSSKLIRVN